MKTVFTFLMLFLIVAMNAQRAGISLEQRQNLEATLHQPIFPHKIVPDSPIQKSNNASAWELSADRVVDSGHRIWSIDMVDSNTIWMVSTFDAFPPPAFELPHVLKSLDGGITWEQYDIPDTEGYNAYDIAGASDQVAYAIINDESFADNNFDDLLYKTQNGGTSWEIVESYPYTPLRIHFFDEDNGWVMGADTMSMAFLVMSVTDDGGETWSHAGGNAQIIPEGRSLPEPDSTELVGGRGFSVNSVYSVVDSTIILGANKSYWLSEDYGYNWQRFDSPLWPARATTLVAMKSRDTFMVASNIVQDYSALVVPFTYATTDGGETWTRSTPPGHLATIDYLPGTEHSFISVGHRNFGVGAVGTYQTDDLENWEQVDDLPLITMDFVGENQGTGLLGNIPVLGDNGNAYKWEVLPPFSAVIDLVGQPDYSITKLEHIQEIAWDYSIRSTGLETLENIVTQVNVFSGEALVYTDETTIESLPRGDLDLLTAEYTPDELGQYEYRIQTTQSNLGTVLEDTQTIEISANTIGKDDGSMEDILTWNASSTSTNPGYIGTIFRLLEVDTLRSISVAIANTSDFDATFKIAIYNYNAFLREPTDVVYRSFDIPVREALVSGTFYEHVLESPLVLPRGRYLFAEGQDSFTGKVDFAVDSDSDDRDGYWQLTPSDAWQTFPNQFVPTVGIRAKFVDSDIMSSTEDINRSPAPFQIFPNPFGDQLNITFEKASGKDFWIELMDVQGKMLLRQQFVPDVMQAFDWKALASGIYFLRVTDGEKVWVEEVVKE
ncbi:MAG: T9SS type A sorting domain-containing protein [Bacteroidota bacterium]